MAPRPLVPVIAGPTGVGKTAVAAAWAELEPITVISADARQVYRGLDVGTAKPAPGLLARVPHVGIDLVEPGTRYSAGRFGGWANRLERFAATFACRAAVKAGQRLEPEEARELVARLLTATLPAHDVHGRPTIVQLPRGELERRFGRA